VEEAAAVAVDTIKAFLEGDDSFEQVILVAFDNDVRSALRKALRKRG
jgi:O-acetyl-ADP-ribose deacetylase (regulator of RNase III)